MTMRLKWFALGVTLALTTTCFLVLARADTNAQISLYVTPQASGPSNAVASGGCISSFGPSTGLGQGWHVWFAGEDDISIPASTAQLLINGGSSAWDSSPHVLYSLNASGVVQNFASGPGHGVWTDNAPPTLLRFVNVTSTTRWGFALLFYAPGSFTSQETSTSSSHCLANALGGAGSYAFANGWTASGQMTGYEARFVDSFIGNEIGYIVAGNAPPVNTTTLLALLNYKADDPDMTDLVSFAQCNGPTIPIPVTAGHEYTLYLNHGGGVSPANSSEYSQLVRFDEALLEQWQNGTGPFSTPSGALTAWDSQEALRVYDNGSLTDATGDHDASLLQQVDYSADPYGYGPGLYEDLGIQMTVLRFNATAADSAAGLALNCIGQNAFQDPPGGAGGYVQDFWQNTTNGVLEGTNGSEPIWVGGVVRYLSSGNISALPSYAGNFTERGTSTPPAFANWPQWMYDGAATVVQSAPLSRGYLFDTTPTPTPPGAPILSGPQAPCDDRVTLSWSTPLSPSPILGYNLTAEPSAYVRYYPPTRNSVSLPVATTTQSYTIHAYSSAGDGGESAPLNITGVYRTDLFGECGNMFGGDRANWAAAFRINVNAANILMGILLMCMGAILGAMLLDAMHLPWQAGGFGGSLLAFIYACVAGLFPIWVPLLLVAGAAGVYVIMHRFQGAPRA